MNRLIFGILAIVLMVIGGGIKSQNDRHAEDQQSISSLQHQLIRAETRIYSLTPSSVYEVGHPCHVSDWRELSIRISDKCLRRQRSELIGKSLIPI